MKIILSLIFENTIYKLNKYSSICIGLQLEFFNNQISIYGTGLFIINQIIKIFIFLLKGLIWDIMI